MPRDGVVHENIDCAEACVCCLDHRRDLARLADVGGVVEDVDAVLLQRRSDTVDRLRVSEAVQHDVAARFREGRYERKADSAGRAGDEGGLSFERHDRLLAARAEMRAIVSHPQ